MKQHQPKNILVINLKFLGDLIVSTAAIRAIKKKYSSSKITVLVRSQYKDVLTGNQYIDEIIAYDFSIKKQKGLSRLKSEAEFLRQLREKHFDAVISLQAGDRFVLWSYLCGAKIRVAPIQNNFGLLLTQKAKVYEDSISYMEYYLKIAQTFGAEPDGMETDFVFNKEYEKLTNDFFNENQISKDDKLICIHPGAGDLTRKWHLKNYPELVKRISSELKCKVIFTLGPQELKQKSEFEAITSSGAIIHVSSNVHHLAWVLKRANLMIGMDSGARHLAAAMKIPTLVLFPEDLVLTWKFYSEEDKHFFITGKRNNSNPENQFLDMIDVDKVFYKVKEIMEL